MYGGLNLQYVLSGRQSLSVDGDLDLVLLWGIIWYGDSCVFLERVVQRKGIYGCRMICLT